MRGTFFRPPHGRPGVWVERRGSCRAWEEGRGPGVGAGAARRQSSWDFGAPLCHVSDPLAPQNDPQRQARPSRPLTDEETREGLLEEANT